MGAFLVVCGASALLIAGATVLSVYLYNKLYKGQPWRGSRLFYPAPGGYATDSNIGLTDVDPVYSGRGILVRLMVALVMLSILVSSALINAIIR